MLTIELETVCFLIVKARCFDAKDAPSDANSGSNPSDDGAVSILEDWSDDATLQEIKGMFDALNEDEMIDLVALMWIGRGDFGADEWDDARQQARQQSVQPTMRYLMGTPLLSDYLAEGLAALGHTCRDFERQHL